MHNTPLETWEAANWTISSLQARSGDIEHVLSKKGTSNVFKYFAVDKPLSEVHVMQEEKDYVEVVYTARTFFDLLRSSFDGFYYYASGGIELLNLEGSGSNESSGSVTFPAHSKAYSEPGQVNFWLGKANVTAHTHYDTSYNLHFVVQGRKKFILFPPDAYARLKLHPCLHQLYRQVDADVPAVANLMDFVREMRGFVVELVDGEVLYIPPFWFHCVVTVETTLSLNVWSQSEAFLVMEEIYKSVIPFEAEWGRVKLMKSLCYFIKFLIDHVLEHGSATDFIANRVYSRYEIILKKRSKVFEPIVSELRDSVQEYCLNGTMSGFLDQDAVSHLEDGAMKIAEKFMDIRPLSVREINLANYVEYLVWTMLRGEDLVQLPLYLHQCFNETVS